MPYQLPAEIESILQPLANAVFPLRAWVQDPARKPPPIDQLVPPVATVPWRPQGARPSLSIDTMHVVDFFRRGFDDDSENERLAPRWLALKGDPLQFFQSPSGNAAEWRARRGLNAAAKFGVHEARSANVRYIVATADGNRAAPRAVFYNSCWPLLAATYQSETPADDAAWSIFADALLKDQLPTAWPVTSPVKSSAFIKQFTIDAVLACLGQHNGALQANDPLWQRAVLVEVSENRHKGNEYTRAQVDAAVTTFVGVVQAPTP